MRAVLDTNTIISGLLWKGSPRQVMDLARDGILELYSCSELLSELFDVLSRHKFAGRLAAGNTSVSELVAGYSALIQRVKVTTVTPIISEDSDDDIVLACALAAECDVVVSGDRHLLALRQYTGIRILTADQLLSEIRY